MKNIGAKWVVQDRLDSDLLSHLLKLRNANDKESFLSPSFENQLFDPETLPNIDTAVNLISENVIQNHTIGIFGDYDADGIPASALLYLGLNQIGAKTVVYIPKRSDGYGLSLAGIDALLGQGAKLIITVDNGTTAIEEINYAKSKGIDVVVVDHHLPHLDLPDAIIVNHKLSDNQYPFDELCATGLVFKLLTYLSKKYPALTEGWLKWHLDLVALATVCDMVPLLGENRVLVHFGLKVINSTRNIGLKYMIKHAGIVPGEISSYHLGFLLGPRINALGRMNEDPMQVFWLLASSETAEVERLSELVNQHNLDRQELLSKAMKTADNLAQDEAAKNCAAIVLAHEDWPVGVVGLIAGRLAEIYRRPTFIFEKTPTIYKGSARSVDPFLLPDIFDQIGEQLESFGGHNFAAGLTLKPEKFETIKTEINRIINQKWPNTDHTKVILIDAEVSLDQISMKLSYLLEQFEPFGLGNLKPKFLLKSVNFSDIKTMGKENNHIRGIISQGAKQIPFVGFGLGDKIKELNQPIAKDIVATLEINRYGGNEKCELRLIDFK
ncbi:MAG: single-stranded-DNA-specific exonuclease RecJ [Patescibacteria group bacterium]|jgi:single-stranded-DNA-specific exonuclease